jgi:hypothetical protein
LVGGVWLFALTLFVLTFESREELVHHLFFAPPFRRRCGGRGGAEGLALRIKLKWHPSRQATN